MIVSISRIQAEMHRHAVSNAGATQASLLSMTAASIGISEALVHEAMRVLVTAHPPLQTGMAAALQCRKQEIL